MGLCKCSKRKVTNLFCFVHRVNVCEECMLSDHSRCTVQSYLKWLEDSDYSNDCVLCAQSVLQGPVVRLTCYDLFHEYCLKKYISRSSPQAQHCPKCKEVLIPPGHFASPVADQLRRTLQATPQSTVPPTQGTPQSTVPPTQGTPQSTIPFTQGTSQRIVPSSSSQRAVVSSSYEDKYGSKVRSPRQWLRAGGTDEGGMCKVLGLVGLVVGVALLLILLLTRVGREVARQDATLDWNYNPHIKTGN